MKFLMPNATKYNLSNLLLPQKGCVLSHFHAPSTEMPLLLYKVGRLPHLSDPIKMSPEMCQSQVTQEASYTDLRVDNALQLPFSEIILIARKLPR